MLLALVAAVFSGVAVFVNSYGVRTMGDATVYTTAKNVVAGAVLLAIVGLLASRRVLRGVTVTVPSTRRQAIGLAAIALVGGCVPFVLFFEGLARIASGPVQAQFINKTLVIWVALLGVVVLRERVGALQVAAVVLLIVGQVKLAGGASALWAMSFGAGEAMILAATILWAIEIVLAKVLLGSLSSWTLALTRMIGGSVLLVAWVLLRGNLRALVTMDLNQWKWVLITGGLLAAYVATWLAALALAPAVSVTAVLVAAVPVTALLQSAVNHSPLAPQLGGLALVAGGAALAMTAALPARRLESVRVVR